MHEIKLASVVIGFELFTSSLLHITSIFQLACCMDNARSFSLTWPKKKKTNGRSKKVKKKLLTN